MKPASVNKMSTVPTETLDELAARVVDLTGRITSYLTAQGLPQPSFARDGGLEEYPEAPQVKGPRMRLIETLWDMLHLAMGGKDYVFMNSIVPHNDAMILSVLDRFDFWSAVPLSGSASYADVAARTQLPETLVRRILRHAMTMRLFAQAGQSSDGPSSGVDAAQDGKSTGSP
ncbi:hypothetical protein VTK73DRAFT_3857 [Phialemonium thermophilum]|uniref:Uncharacterized protein n=1 Tax=Phialemonium thermophilum TaxID=223376 RepID=A0ABR3VEM5_9PEZI